jgi:predicted nucleotidyltransferase
MTSKENILSTLRAHKTVLSKLGVSAIGLFGSYSRDEQSPKSDIDLLIDFEPAKENFDNFMSVCGIVEQLFENEKIEVVTKRGLSKYIAPHILNSIVYV